MAANGGSKEIDFNALYQSSLRLTTAIDDFGIPRLERNLEQLDDASRTFYQHQQQVQDQVPQAGLQKKRAINKKSTMDQANFLLASKGIDAEKLSKELQAFEIKPGYEQEPALATTDIEGFLTHHHEQIILSAIEDGHRQTMERTQEHMNQAMIDDFERLKQQVLDDLGTSKQLGIRNYPRIMETLQNENSNVFANNDMFESKSSVGNRFDRSQAGSFFTPSSSTGSKLSMSQLSGVTESRLTEEMKNYYQVIRTLHTSRTPSVRTQYDVADGFQRVCAEHVSSTTIGSKWEAVLKCWQVLTCMIKGGDASEGNRVINERAFASSGQDEDKRIHQQQRFAYGARVFLEKQFRAFVQHTVQSNQLPVGGVPDLVSNVRAFVKFIKSSSASTSIDTGDVDIWALLYYCLRSGGEAEAIQLASSYLSANGTSTLDESVLIGLRYRDQVKRSMMTKVDGTPGAPPPGALSQLFPNEYNQLVDRYQRLTSTSVDAIAFVNPYERCVLNLLCFGNPNASEPRILTTIEDYLWQRLSFIQRGASPDSTYTIARLAKSIQKFGPSHFEGTPGSSGSQAHTPFLFFEILLISQAFDQALAYLSSRGFILEAVHFAIALHYYGLVSVGDREQAMDDDDEQTTHVDLVRLVRQYIHAFQRTNAVEAAEYIVCLADSPAMSGLLIDLILESRKFDALVGFTNNTDGSRTPGAIDRLLANSKQDVRELILTVARKAEERGNLHDAITLLKAAGDMEGVISLLNIQLGSALSAPRAEREEWFRVAKEFAEKWMRFPWVQTIATKYARTAAIAFQALLNISIFFEMYEQGKSEEAIRFVDELEIIPTPSLNNLAVCVDRFLVFDETVRRNFHVLLLSYVECLVRDTERVKVQTVGEVRHVSIATLREKAELVNTFANMIKFRLTQGTMERLNRMEAMIY